MVLNEGQHEIFVLIVIDKMGPSVLVPDDALQVIVGQPKPPFSLEGESKEHG